VKLAKGADVLVHEALYLPALDRLVARATNPELAKKHHLRATRRQMRSEDRDQGGRQDGRALAFVPGDDPSITDEMWAADVRGTSPAT
jgi:hypothetical protein